MKLFYKLHDLLFRKPSAMELAVRHLEEAKRLALEQQSAASYHAKLAEYYEETVDRLTEYIGCQ